MAKGQRAATGDRIVLATAKQPYALGPILGRMIVAANMSPVTAANVLAVCEPTLYRWMFALSNVSSSNLPRVAKLLATLSWILTEREPLRGTVAEREAQFIAYLKEMKGS